MKKILTFIILYFFSALLYAEPNGRGMEVDNDSPWNMGSAFSAFIWGIAFLAIGLLLMRLYNTKYDRAWIEKPIHGLMIFGTLSILPILSLLWKYIIYPVLVGFVIFVFWVHQNKTAKSINSADYYLTCIVGLLCCLFERIKILYKKSRRTKTNMLSLIILTMVFSETSGKKSVTMCPIRRVKSLYLYSDQCHSKWQ